MLNQEDQIDMEEFDFLAEEMLQEQDFDLDWGEQYVCPNCGEPFDSHHCENCSYTEMYF